MKMNAIIFFRKFYWLLVCCLYFLLSCSADKTKESSSQPDDLIDSTAEKKFSTDSIYSNIKCNLDPSASFALYLPPGYNQDQKLPAIVFFDPQANGSLPLKMYRSLAGKFGFILIGSNDSKNGIPVDESDRIARLLVKELVSRFSANEKLITLAGFSGGGKAAIAAAEKDSTITSVIYAGAASPFRAASHSLSLLGFAGKGDMNYTDLLLFDQSLEKTNVPHLLIEWNGKHEWPDSSVFGDAFYWLSFLAMKNNLQSKDGNMIKEFMKA
jgi:poly(3-hydroxybutyrate) depolymerase